MIRLSCILCSFCLVIFALHLYEGVGFIAVAASQPPPPNFIPVSEELLPLKTRIVSISARDTPLRDVLHVIAEATGLNLVMEKGVNPEIPLTVTLKHISAEDALNIIVASVDYFYSVKENILTVKAMDTRVFEFGQPPVIQDYAVDVGGDILGGVAGITTTTGMAAGTTGLRGGVTQRIEADKVAFKLWDSIEKAIAGLPGIASFSVNRMTGTIIVTATKKDLERVENYLAAIKKALNRQVIIEARIVEVQLSESLRYGIDWTAVLEKSGLGRVTVGTEKFATVVTEALSNFHIGITGRDFTALLKALQTQGNVRVLSNPRVNIMNGQTSLLNVGRNVNFISRVETTTTTAATGVLPTTTFTVETSGILSGIIIGIVPYISDTGEISLAITPIVSDLIRLEDKTLGKVGENTIQISLPTVDLRQLSTTVRVKDGEMVIIGGLMQRKETLEDSKVPLLGDIPLIGYLFKSRKRLDEKTELVIMLKPTIVTP
ncbi:MAG: pilus (MSHA type) biogenesis protein MshL [Nitrospirota bacterium]